MTLIAQIDTLIDKADSFELIEDQVAAILVVESANQQALATAAGKDPKLWKLRVFQSRSNPWEEFAERDGVNPNKRKDTSPIVSVSFDSDAFDRSKGNVVQRQQADGVFNIDCYGFGVGRSDGGTGHIPGDADANDEASRAARLVRNILMASQYTYLALTDESGTNFIGRRWFDSRTFFQPSLDGVAIDPVQAIRLSFAVTYNEFSPQYTPQILESIVATVRRAETGQVYLVATLPDTSS